MWSHFVFIFKAKEQNKLSGGENGLMENEREKPNNLLNNLEVKGLVESFKSKKALWHKLESPASESGRGKGV